MLRKTNYPNPGDVHILDPSVNWIGLNDKSKVVIYIGTRNTKDRENIDIHYGIDAFFGNIVELRPSNWMTVNDFHDLAIAAGKAYAGRYSSVFFGRKHRAINYYNNLARTRSILKRIYEYLLEDTQIVTNAEGKMEPKTVIMNPIIANAVNVITGYNEYPDYTFIPRKNESEEAFKCSHPELLDADLSDKRMSMYHDIVISIATAMSQVLDDYNKEVLDEDEGWEKHMDPHFKDFPTEEDEL